MNIRNTILTAKTLFGSLLLLSCQGAGEKSSEHNETRPNILLSISDDQSWPHAGAHGDKVVRTPAFDQLAKKGVLFNNAYAPAPSCTPSRSGILTGQDIWRLEEGSQLFGTLPAKFATYTELLEKSGYKVGYMNKGWGPGNVQAGGRTHNPAGSKSYGSFEDFLKEVPPGTPWCFMHSSRYPHRGYEKGSGEYSGIDINAISKGKGNPL